ncbi:ABC transporter, ATP-binding protein [Tissierellia bacterium KA00581]|nr:ABC transporter, ATP-binding protein [Tissierellia bacterium KA00581]
MIKKRLIYLLKDSKKYIVYDILFKLLGLFSQIIMVFTITRVIQKAMYLNLTNTDILMFFIVFCLVLFIRVFSDKMSTRCSYLASCDVKIILRKKIYEKLLKLGTSYRQKVSTAEVVQITTEGVEQLEVYFGKYLPQFFYSMIAPIILFIILSFISFKISIVLLIFVPLIPLSIVMVAKIAKKLLSKYWNTYTGLGDSFLENLQGLTTLKVYRADEDRSIKMDKEATKFRKVTMKVLIMQLNSISVMDIVAFGGASIGMILSVIEVINKNITFSNALMIILLASEFFIPVRLLGSFFHISMNAMAACDKIFYLLDLEEIKNGKKVCDEKNMQIEFSNVSFSYDEKRDILKNINLTFNKNKITSLVGKSGSGKSTIANIISGKIKNFKGDIFISKIKLLDIDEKNLLKNITIVSHNSYIFKGTVRENLLMADENLTDFQMNKALKQVNLFDFLQRENGLDTKILEKGSNFSGGQLQRLAIARAILKNSSVYIFDEATSNIDSESEKMIMKVIFELAKEKTIILISHKLSNVIYSDNIYFIEDGEIVASGKHKELLEKNKDYKKLYDLQYELENYKKGANI